jgi:hypothetical protein
VTIGAAVPSATMQISGPSNTFDLGDEKIYAFGDVHYANQFELSGGIPLRF